MEHFSESKSLELFDNLVLTRGLSSLLHKKFLVSEQIYYNALRFLFPHKIFFAFNVFENGQISLGDVFELLKRLKFR